MPIQLEIQLLDDDSPKLKGKLASSHITGSVYGVVSPDPRADAPINRWHHMSIRALGPRITVRVNNVQIVDANLDDLQSEINGKFQYTQAGPDRISVARYSGSIPKHSYS